MNNNRLHDQLYDIYGVWHVPWWQTWQFYACIIALVVIFCILLFVYLVKKWRARKRVLKPWQKALRSLEELNKKNVLTNAKEFYSRLTHILKTYIHERFNYPIIDKTDDELLAYLAVHQFSPELLERIQTIFSRAVTSKFAQQSNVDIDTMRNDLLMCSAIIENTIPKAR